MACPPIFPIILKDTWQRFVLDRDLQNPPVDPKKGDRYIIPNGAQSSWFGKTDWITEWDGENWIFTEPEQGMVTYIKDEDLYVQFDTSWTDFGSSGATDHGNLTGLNDDDHSQYALLAGRSSGQILKGGSDAAGSLTLRGTSNTTPGPIIIGDALNFKINSISTNTTLSAAENVILLSGSPTITLPSPVSDRIYYLMNTGTGIITINPNSTEKINGETELKLFVQYDAVRLISNGTDWFILNDSRIKHFGEMTRDSAQSIPNNSTTKINLDTTQNDIGGIVDAANDRIQANRDSVYLIIGFVTIPNIGDQEFMQSRIHINGTALQAQKQLSPGGAQNVSSIASLVTLLNTNDHVELFTFQNSGASQNTPTASVTKPRFMVVEL